MSFILLCTHILKSHPAWTSPYLQCQKCVEDFVFTNRFWHSISAVHLQDNVEDLFEVLVDVLHPPAKWSPNSSEIIVSENSTDFSPPSAWKPGWKQDRIDPILDDSQIETVVFLMLRSSHWNSRSISITIAITDFSNTPGISPEAKFPPIFSQSKIINSESINRTRYLFRTISIFQYQIINWSKEPWRQFATNYGAACGSLEQTKTPTTHTHTRSKTKTDEALSESTQKTRPTVSANPHPPMEDKHVRQAKLSSASNTHSPKSTFVVSLVLNVNTLMHQANSASNKLYTRCAELRTR